MTSSTSIAPNSYLALRQSLSHADFSHRDATQTEFSKSRFATMRPRPEETGRGLFDNMEIDMKHVYNDGGRSASGFKGSAGDCVARSIAIVTGRPYKEVYSELAMGTGNQRRSKRNAKRAASARSGINVKRKWFRDYMRHLGLKWTPCMKIGTGCKVHLADGELPMGKLVVSLSGHYTAVLDGVIHDTHDPQRGKSYSFEPDRGQELKANQGRNQNGVWTEIGGRCVYGYWS